MVDERGGPACILPDMQRAHGHHCSHPNVRTDSPSPPTQRTGLLVSPTAFSKDERADRQEAPKPRASLRPQKEKRSVDQGANLKDSFRRMLDALNGPVRNSATA